MSKGRVESISDIANLIHIKYNYRIITVDWTCHYYNGNSSSLSRFQYQWGSFCGDSRFLGAFRALNRPQSQGAAEPGCIGSKQSGQQNSACWKPHRDRPEQGRCSGNEGRD
jgi:hypothetical protein